MAPCSCLRCGRSPAGAEVCAPSPRSALCMQPGHCWGRLFVGVRGMCSSACPQDRTGRGVFPLSPGETSRAAAVAPSKLLFAFSASRSLWQGGHLKCKCALPALPGGSVGSRAPFTYSPAGGTGLRLPSIPAAWDGRVENHGLYQGIVPAGSGSGAELGPSAALGGISAPCCALEG